jgi:membrane-associated HD superfamily phosphohydrolase
MRKNSQKENTKKTEDAGLKKIYTSEERIYPRRVASLLLFAAATVFFMAVNALSASLATGGFICEAVLIVPICLCTILLLIHKRRSGQLWYQDTDYLAFVIIYIIANAMLSVLSFLLPESLIPVGIAAFLCAASGNGEIALITSMLSAVSLAFPHGYNGGIYALFFCEAIIAAALSDVIVKSGKKEKILLFAAAACVYTALPLSVKYFISLKITKNYLYFSIGLSIITAAVAVLIMPMLYRRLHMEKRYRYETILDDDYSLINEIKLFSGDEYERARRLSVVSLKAAQAIGADAPLAAAGGLYYRVGLLRGDNEIEYALDIAGEHGFPDQLMSILYEYQGLIRKPTTRESAIVHMADAVMRRMDAISKQSDKMDSGWNRQMLIYSCLNDLSTKGYYDASPISMNQFLKIRDVLVKELQ